MSLWNCPETTTIINPIISPIICSQKNWSKPAFRLLENRGVWPRFCRNGREAPGNLVRFGRSWGCFGRFLLMKLSILNTFKSTGTKQCVPSNEPHKWDLSVDSLLGVDSEESDELKVFKASESWVVMPRLRTPGHMFGWTRAPWLLILVVSVSVSAERKTWTFLRFLGCFPLQPCIIPDVDTCSLARTCQKSNKSWWVFQVRKAFSNVPKLLHKILRFS